MYETPPVYESKTLGHASNDRQCHASRQQSFPESESGEVAVDGEFESDPAVGRHDHRNDVWVRIWIGRRKRDLPKWS